MFDTFNVEIDTSKGAAFQENAEYELATILRNLADEVENGNFERTLRDSNGNRVGFSFLDH